MGLPQLRWNPRTRWIAAGVTGVAVISGAAVGAGFLIFGGGGGDSDAVLQETREPIDIALTRRQPTPTPTHTPTPVPTPKPTPTAELMPTIIVVEAFSARAEPILTAAEVIQCEGGQFDGWDDAFNLLPYGFTSFPAALTVTTDPAACEALWLTAYDGGYARGKNDRCSIVSDYPTVSSAEELEFCGVEPPPPPTPTSIISAAEAGILVFNWANDSGYDFGLGSQCSGVAWEAGVWLVECKTRDPFCSAVLAQGLLCRGPGYWILQFHVYEATLLVAPTDETWSLLSWLKT